MRIRVRIFPVLLPFLLVLAGCTGGASRRHGDQAYLHHGLEHAMHLQSADRELIIETINQLFIATDQRDWKRVEGLFAPSVRFDMTSLVGGVPLTLTPRQIAETWEQGLGPLKAVHHQAGNYIVSVQGSEADAFCYATATHYLPTKSGRNTRTFVGSYDIHLTKQNGVWWIDAFRFDLKYLTGNPNLEKDQ